MIRAYLRQHHVGLIALLLIVLSGGSAYAAATIGAGDIKANAVRAKHIKDGQVRGAEADEASMEVSRVVNRARGTGDQVITNVSTNFPLSEGAIWTQAANEVVFTNVGQVTIDRQGCTGGGTSMVVQVKVNNQLVDAQVVILTNAPTASFAGTWDVPLFEPGTATSRSLALEVLQNSPCSGGGPLMLEELVMDVIGAR